MSKKRFTRFLAVLLAIVMLVQSVPAQVFAVSGDTPETAEETTQAELKESASIPDEESDSMENVEILEEITDRRTEFSKEFALSNGLHMTTVYAEAVHFQKEGRWQEIDNTLQRTELQGKDVYTNTDAGWQVFFPDALSENRNISILKGDFALHFRMNGEIRVSGEDSASQMRISADDLRTFPAEKSSAEIMQVDTSEAKRQAKFEETVTEKQYARLGYENVYENTDIIFDLVSNQVKESVVMEQHRPDLVGYSYILEADNLVPILTEGNEILLYAEDGENPIMQMPAPYLFDNGGEFSFDVQISLEQKGDQYLLTYTLPRQWLADAGRQWPVTLDPVVSSIANNSNADDQTVYENTNMYTSHTSLAINSGYNTSCQNMRTYIRYNNLPQLGSADMIVSASIELYATEKEGTAPVLEIREVLEDWDPAEIRWNDQPDYSTIVEDFAICTKKQTAYNWDITDIVRSWYSGTNHGMVIKGTNAQEAAQVNNWLRFYSANFSSTHKPIMSIVFRNNNGLESYWDYTASSAGRAGMGYINNYTGNLVWIRSDLGFDGNRMPVSISHVYNSNDSMYNTFGLGYGWRTNYHQRVYPWETDGTYYVWEDSDGTKHYFKLVTTGEYKDEDGLDLTLTIVDNDNGKYCIADRYGNCSYFDAKGRLTKLQNNQATPSNITITYTADTGNLISTIKDGVERVYAFSYSGNLLDRISYKGTGSGELTYVRFGYNDYSALTSIMEKLNENDEVTVTYTYTPSQDEDVTKMLLTSALDVDGYKLAYEYNTTSVDLPNRVSRVSESDGSASGGWINITYAQKQTTFADQSGNIQIHQFNNFGNTTCIQDNQGRAHYADYTLNDIPGTETTERANQMTLSSKMQNTVGNMLNDTSFESSTLWTATSSAVTRSIASGTAYLGNKSLKMVRSAAGTAAGVYSASFSAAAGKTYTFSAYVKTVGGSAYLALHDGSTTVSSQVLAADSGWTRLEVSYTAPAAKTVTARLMTADAGTVYLDCVQVEQAPTASRYNLIQNGDFRHSTGWSSTAGHVTKTAAAPELNSRVYKIAGDPTKIKHVTQEVIVSGGEGDTFVLAGWGKADSAPLSAFDTNPREFGLIATFNYTDGTTSTHAVHFNPYVPSEANWQYAAAAIRAAHAYSSITVAFAYDHNVNIAWFDGIQLYKEEFGSTYAYDEFGNVTGVTDIQGQKTEYEYTDNHEVELIRLPTGVEMTYEYDDYHNVTKATTPEGAVYEFTYDDYGNTLSVTATAGDTTMTTSAEYSDNGNRLKSTTDAAGNKTAYAYDGQTSLLTIANYPADTSDNPDTRTKYKYDKMYRPEKITANTNTGLALSVEYGYTEDHLSKIKTPSTQYDFTYGAFGLRSAVKIGNRTLAAYTYENATNYLKTLAYGNGDGVEYTYDNQGRVITETYKDNITSDTPTVEKTVSYGYDNSGYLASVTDSGSGITTKYFYDFAGRVARYSESGGHTHTADYQYDSSGNLTQLFDTILGTVYKTYYYYDTQNRVTKVYDGGVQEEYEYDKFNRIESKTFGSKTKNVGVDTFIYFDSDTTNTSGQVEQMSTVAAGYNVTNNYTYDGNGNITAISDGTNTTTYVYDTANQLIRENNQAADKTWTWEYDNAGNISKRHEYDYTTDALGDPDDTVEYKYDGTWGDLLTEYDGQAISSDAIGNMTYDGTWTYSWKYGRQLASMTNGTTTWNYTYNNDGIRSKRTDGTTTYTYYYNGSNLRYLDINGTKLYFVLDATGQPVEVSYVPAGTTKTQVYYFVMNLQGDVTAILNTSGSPVVQYTYDAWGNILSITGSMASTLGVQNPFRYRGYVYDTETQLYYCQSRYYDPTIGRFINADAFTSTGQGLLGNNMFAYCNNNPVNLIDFAGNSPDFFYENPFDPYAQELGKWLYETFSNEEKESDSWTKKLVRSVFRNIEVSAGIGLGLLYEKTVVEVLGVGGGIYYNPISVQLQDGHISAGQEFSQGASASMFFHNYGYTESGYSRYGERMVLEESKGFHADDTLTLFSASWYFIGGGTIRIGFDIVEMTWDLDRIFDR